MANTAEEGKSFPALCEGSAMGVGFFAADGVLLACNGAFAALLDLPRERLIGTNTAGGAADAGARAALAAALSGAPTTLRCEIAGAAGTPARTLKIASSPIGATGSAEGVLVFIDDVTEACRGSAAQRGSEARLQAIFDASPVAIGITRVEDGRLVDVNPAFVQLFARTREELIGRTTLELGFWADRQSRERFTERLEREAQGVTLEARYRTGRGTTIDTLVTARRVVLDGEPCTLAMVLDITERREAEEARRRYGKRLIELDETLRRSLAAELHDEVGRDLTALGLTMSIIETGAGPASRERLGARFEDAHRLVAGISRAVRGLMARLRPPVLDDYGLPAALRWHGDLFSQRTGLEVAVEVREPFPRLSPDKEVALFRIAQEALTNAAKHSGAAIVAVELESKAGTVRLTIHDEGHGFVPSRSIPPPRADAGLGLTIMRERAAAIGGRLELRASPGEGTRISVFVPEGS